MEAVERLVRIFRRFPGIGPRQARRFVYFLLGAEESYLQNLTEALKELKKEIRECIFCHRFFSGSSNKCSICRSVSRDSKLLMVVERDSDLEAMEKSAGYNGLYFVLGGTASLALENEEDRIRLGELSKRVKEDKKIEEIILALSVTAEGEHTAEIIQKTFSSLSGKRDLKITFLGRGLSTGSELEYSDSDTLKSALLHRR